jgi:FKBP-type peptidyl-prolyl cis-trans isomerase
MSTPAGPTTDRSEVREIERKLLELEKKWLDAEIALEGADDEYTNASSEEEKKELEVKVDDTERDVEQKRQDYMDYSKETGMQAPRPKKHKASVSIEESTVSRS